MYPKHYNVSEIVLLTLFGAISTQRFFINNHGDWGDLGSSFGGQPLSFIDSLYLIITSLFNAYGDITPKSTKAKLFIILLQFIMLLELYVFIFKNVYIK